MVKIQNMCYLINNKKIVALFWVLLLLMSGCGNTEIPNEINNEEQFIGNLDYKWIIPPSEYEDITAVDTDLFAVKNGEHKWGVVNGQGIEFLPCEYDYISTYTDGYSTVCKDGEYWLVDQKGERVNYKIFLYDEVRPYSEGLFAAVLHDKWGYLDIDGRKIIDFIYDYAGDFKEGLAVVMNDGKYGIIDKENNIIVELKYDNIRDYKEGYAAVLTNGKWGFIDSKGNEVIACQYDEVGNFSENKAAVYIDEKGQPVFRGSDSPFFICDFDYNVGLDTIPGYVYIDEAMKEKKYGLFGLDGSTRITPQFDYIYSVWNDFDEVEEKENSGYFAEYDYDYNYANDITSEVDYIISASFSIQDELVKLEELSLKYENMVKNAGPQSDINRATYFYCLVWDTELNRILDRILILADEETKEQINSSFVKWQAIKDNMIDVHCGIHEVGTIYPELCNLLAERMKRTKVYILADELAKIKGEKFDLPDASKESGVFVNVHRVGEEYDYISNWIKSIYYHRSAEISFAGVGVFKGDLSEICEGEYLFVSDEGNLDGIIRINGWDGASFEVTHCSSEIVLNVGDIYEFGLILGLDISSGFE